MPNFSSTYHSHADFHLATLRLCVTIICCCLACGTLGCAQLSPRLPKPKEHAEVHAEQSAEMIAAFEAKRNQAQYQVALTRWQEGDVAESRMQLDKLLVRAPQHREGRLLRAEMQLYENQAAAALADLEALIAEAPTDAEAIHLYGLALDAAGRHDEALVQLTQAAKLAPQNEVFAASLQMVQEQTTSQAAVATHTEPDTAEAIIAD